MATEGSGPAGTIGVNSSSISSSPLPSFSAASSPSSEFTFAISLYPSPPTPPPPPPPPPPPTTVAADEAEKRVPTTKDEEDVRRPNNIFLQSRIFPLRHSHRRPHLPARNRAEPQAAAPRRSAQNTLSLWFGRSKRRWLEVGRAVRRWIEAALVMRDYRGRKGSSGGELRRSMPFSFSCNSYSTNSSSIGRGGEGRRSGGACSREWMRTRVREASSSRTAPHTAKTTPTNSGLLIGKGKTMGISSSDESTMEELHSAIQAAIAHCKNSIATTSVDDNLQHITKKSNTHSPPPSSPQSPS